ncbi:MAG: SMP-30/gluconolactonase/LRE family protein [Clostridia bacterium]|nr:SMP-30/gluconolactonase/LRE family protein [Clostridia bacterium]
MECVSTKRCIIGEAPIWNAKEKKLYFVNGFESEILSVDITTKELNIRKVEKAACAISFDKDYRMIVSRWDGAFYLNPDGTEEPLCDLKEYPILYGNDAKVGPDGRYYIGTQCEKRVGASDKINGKLWRIDKNGKANAILDGLLISNGFDWSADERFLYHTDSDTRLVKEYEFDKATGDIEYTGRSVMLPGVDGMTVDLENNLYVACMRENHIAVVDTKEFKVKSYIKTDTFVPASCSYAGENMDRLAIVTATYNVDLEHNPDTGMTFLYNTGTKGRAPYLFG